jgi:hypothetical protein
MKTFLTVLLCALTAQAVSVTPYKTPLAFLATRYRAFHTCNCLYVMKMNQDYCINYSKVEPQIFTVNIDAANKSVSSGIMGMDFKPVVAKFTGARTGCNIVAE